MILVFRCSKDSLNSYITLQGLRGQNVSSSNFQWQILNRMKQISIFCKVESCRVKS